MLFDLLEPFYTLIGIQYFLEDLEKPMGDLFKILVTQSKLLLTRGVKAIEGYQLLGLSLLGLLFQTRLLAGLFGFYLLDQFSVSLEKAINFILEVS